MKIRDNLFYRTFWSKPVSIRRRRKPYKELYFVESASLNITLYEVDLFPGGISNHSLQDQNVGTVSTVFILPDTSFQDYGLNNIEYKTFNFDNFYDRIGLSSTSYEFNKPDIIFNDFGLNQTSYEKYPLDNGTIGINLQNTETKKEIIDSTNNNLGLYNTAHYFDITDSSNINISTAIVVDLAKIDTSTNDIQLQGVIEKIELNEVSQEKIKLNVDYFDIKIDTGKTNVYGNFFHNLTEIDYATYKVYPQTNLYFTPVNESFINITPILDLYKTQEDELSESNVLNNITYNSTNQFYDISVLNNKNLEFLHENIFEKISLSTNKSSINNVLYYYKQPIVVQQYKNLATFELIKNYLIDFIKNSVNSNIIFSQTPYIIDFTNNFINCSNILVFPTTDFFNQNTKLNVFPSVFHYETVFDSVSNNNVPSIISHVLSENDIHFLNLNINLKYTEFNKSSYVTDFTLSSNKFDYFFDFFEKNNFVYNVSNITHNYDHFEKTFFNINLQNLSLIFDFFEKNNSTVNLTDIKYVYDHFEKINFLANTSNISYQYDHFEKNNFNLSTDQIKHYYTLTPVYNKNNPSHLDYFYINNNKTYFYNNATTIKSDFDEFSKKIYTNISIGPYSTESKLTFNSSSLKNYVRQISQIWTLSGSIISSSFIDYTDDIELTVIGNSSPGTYKDNLDYNLPYRASYIVKNWPYYQYDTASHWNLPILLTAASTDILSSRDTWITLSMQTGVPFQDQYGFSINI